MGKCIKSHKIFKRAKLAQAGEMKALLAEWSTSLPSPRTRAQRYTVAQLSARFTACKLDMLSGSARDNRGHEVLPGESTAIAGMRFAGIIERSAATDGDWSELIPADCDTFSVSLNDFKTLDGFVFVLANDSGELRPVAYK